MSRKTALTVIAAFFALYVLILAAEVFVFLPRQEVAAVSSQARQNELMTGGDDGRTAKELLPSEKIDINTAGIEELERLPGIGPALAEKIIEYRCQEGAFRSIEDIMNVAGIGSGRYEEIADHIIVEGSDNENSGS